MHSQTNIKPSIQRALRSLGTEYQQLITERYERILPILLQKLTGRDILERNRAWPGCSPQGKGATTLLTHRGLRQLRAALTTYVKQHPEEDASELYALLYAYCRYGPIGLVEALPSHLPPLIDERLQELADFHRLGKHPRSDIGIYIRNLLEHYCDALGIPRLPDFVARYTYATDRKITRWFLGDSATTERVSKTTRRLNVDEPYPHRRWIARVSKLPLRCYLSQRRSVLIEPWMVWMYDEMTTTLMGFRLCASQPTMQDYRRTLRWSIWHFDAPWWKARGIPDHLVLPSAAGPLHDDAQRALRYLHTEVEHEDTACTAAEFVGFPEDFADWLGGFDDQTGSPTPHNFTLAALQQHILDYVRDSVEDKAFAQSAPSALSEQGVSLPWSAGIGAVLLLPSAGTHTVREGQIIVSRVPFDARGDGLEDGTTVDVRLDPDDARSVFLIREQAQVVRAYACAFEHRLPWCELTTDLAQLEELV